MSNLILLVVCFIAGLLLRQSGKLPDNAHVTLNGFIIHVALPALTLLHIHGLHVDSTLIFVVAMAWLLFGLGVLLFWVLGRLAGLTRSTTGALMLTGGLGNTSFVGLPMIETFYGKEGMATGILIDQLGSYLVLSTVGIVVAGLYAEGRPDATTLFKKVASFPPFLALLLALALPTSTIRRGSSKPCNDLVQHLRRLRWFLWGCNSSSKRSRATSQRSVQGLDSSCCWRHSCWRCSTAA